MHISTKIRLDYESKNVPQALEPSGPRTLLNWMNDSKMACGFDMCMSLYLLFDSVVMVIMRNIMPPY